MHTRRQCCMAVVSSCREILLGLSPATSATLVLSYQRVMVGTLKGLPVRSRRKVGMTSTKHGPLRSGRHTYITYCNRTEGSNTVMWSQSLNRSSVRSRRLQTRLREAGIAIKQISHAALNTFPGPCTHRPSRHPSLLHPKSLF